MRVDRPVTRSDALQRGQRLQQRPVDGEVLLRDGLVALRLLRDRRQKLLSCSMFEQSLRILREGRVVQRRVTDVETEEPLEEQVIVQALAELPLAAQRVQCHQERALQQVLRWHRTPTAGRVHRGEGRRQFRQRCVGDLPNPPNGMTNRYQVIGRHPEQHVLLALIWSSHHALLALRT